MDKEIQFELKNGTPNRYFLSPYERAQSISFVTRFEHLPTDYSVRIAENGGTFHLANMSYLRHVLNEFRPVVQNERDSVYYRRIHRTWRAMLAERDLFKKTVITVVDRSERDVSQEFLAWLDQSCRATSHVIDKMDFGYLYNGFLQHSDQRFTERFLNDYVSGELNYILVKHVAVLQFVRERLLPYYTLAQTLASPRLGPLPK